MQTRVPTATQLTSLKKWTRAGVLYADEKDSYSRPAARQSIREMKTMGLNTVTLVVEVYQASPSSSGMYRSYQAGDSVTDASLVSAITFIRSQGMRAVVKLHVDVDLAWATAHPGKNAWRGWIKAADRDAWFTSYNRWLVHYGRLAQSARASDIIIGTEMVSMTSTPARRAKWVWMIRNLRKVFHGRLTYCANKFAGNLGTEYKTVDFWRSLDYISISGYFGLDSATSAGMKKIWAGVDKAELYPLHKKYDRDIMFGEVGYRSETGARREPSQFRTRNAFDETEQSQDYEALLDFWSTRAYLSGVQLWRFYPDLGHDWMEAAASFTPQTTVTKELLTRWFTGKNPAVLISLAGMPQGQPVEASQPLEASVTAPAKLAYLLKVSVDGTATTPMTPVAGAWTMTLDTSGWAHRNSRNHLHSVEVQALSPTGSLIARQVSMVYAPDLVVVSPANMAVLSGKTTLSARLSDVPLSDYKLFWSVGTGDEVELQDHPDLDSWVNSVKSRDVDLSGWTWEPSGMYSITFTARRPDGSLVAQAVRQIMVTPAEVPVS